jgi:hypothetical protein
MDEDTLNQNPQEPRASNADLRRVCDFLQLWRLCPAARCGRTSECRGAPRECLMRRAPLVPPGARAFVAGLLQLKQSGRPFEEATWRLWEEQRAFDAWIEALETAAGQGACEALAQTKTPPCGGAFA